MFLLFLTVYTDFTLFFYTFEKLVSDML